MKRRATVLLAIVGCAPAVPEHPTWYADVQPILRANCVRCHDGKRENQVNTNSRFDLYDDPMPDPQPDLWTGLWSAAKFSRATIVQNAVDFRTSLGGDRMPPAPFPELPDDQKQILKRWADDPQKGARPAKNRPPIFELTSPVASTAKGSLTINFRANDPDFDGLWGVIKYGSADSEVAAYVYKNGVDSATWDTTGVPAATYMLTAVVRDDEAASAPVTFGPVTIPP